jgi:hypothetical protein
MGVLASYDKQDILYLVAYFTGKYLSVAINYEIYDMELRALIDAFN